MGNRFIVNSEEQIKSFMFYAHLLSNEAKASKEGTLLTLSKYNRTPSNDEIEKLLQSIGYDSSMLEITHAKWLLATAEQHGDQVVFDADECRFRYVVIRKLKEDEAKSTDDAVVQND